MHIQKTPAGIILGVIAIAVFFFALASDRKHDNSNDARRKQISTNPTLDENLDTVEADSKSSIHRRVGMSEAKFSDGDAATINWYVAVPDFLPPVGPAEANHDRLKTEAEAGSGIAAYVLSEMMRTCSRTYVTRADLDVAIDKLQQTHTFINPANNKEMRIADPENLDSYVKYFHEDFEYCEGVTAEQRAAHLSWLEMSANNGFPLGMIEYGKHVSDPVISAGLFESAWKLGNGEALVLLSESYSELYEQGVDPGANVLSYAAMKAYDVLLASSRGPNEQVNSRVDEIRSKLNKMRGTLLPHQLDEAEQIAKSMITSNRNCCSAM